MAHSNEQNNSYEASIARMGVTPTDHSNPNGGPTILSADPAESTVPPHLVKVNNIDELKDLLALPLSDTDDPEEINKAMAPLKDMAREALSTADRVKIKAAAQAYVTGSANIMQSIDKATINRAMFPMTLATFASTSHTVSPGDPLIIKDGALVSYDTLTVEQNATVLFQG